MSHTHGYRGGDLHAFLALMYVRLSGACVSNLQIDFMSQRLRL